MYSEYSRFKDNELKILNRDYKRRKEEREREED
jgi:hypothetical protein